jgi:hypothetical protein
MKLPQRRLHRCWLSSSAAVGKGEPTADAVYCRARAHRTSRLVTNGPARCERGRLTIEMNQSAHLSARVDAVSAGPRMVAAPPGCGDADRVDCRRHRLCGHGHSAVRGAGGMRTVGLGCASTTWATTVSANPHIYADQPAAHRLVALDSSPGANGRRDVRGHGRVHADRPLDRDRPERSSLRRHDRVDGCTDGGADARRTPQLADGHRDVRRHGRADGGLSCACTPGGLPAHPVSHVAVGGERLRGRTRRHAPRDACGDGLPVWNVRICAGGDARRGFPWCSRSVRRGPSLRWRDACAY